MESPKNLYGFATFFKLDGLHYFQFNDKAGEPILYSHGYQSEKSRDNGIQSVIRNAGNPQLYELKKTKKGQPYFLLKAANHQEIGRSRMFDTEQEMQEKMDLLRGIKKNVPIYERTELLSKKEVLQKSSQKPASPSSKSEKKGKMPRHKFSFIYYPDSKIWLLKHDQSGESKNFKEYDGKLIKEFLFSHLPLESAEEEWGPEKKVKTPEVPAPKAIPQKIPQALQEAIELRIRSFEGNQIQNFAKAGNLGQLEILPKEKSIVPDQAYDVKIVAKSLTDHKTLEIGTVKQQVPKQGRLLVSIIEANNKLKPGSYRLIATIHQGKEEGAPDLYGSKFLMLN